MPGAKWFKSSRLNFSENLLKYNNNNIAIEFYCEDRDKKSISFKSLSEMSDVSVISRLTEILHFDELESTNKKSNK